MISFIKDDFTVSDKDKLKHIVHVVNSKPHEYEAKAVFLRNFVDALVISATKVKKSPDHDKMAKEELMRRKEEILKRLTDIKTKSKREIKEKVWALTKISGVKEVVCDGPGENLKLIHKDGQVEETEVRFEKIEVLNEFVLQLGGMAKVHVDEHRPFINSLVDNKFHVQATLGSEFFRPKFVISVI